MSILKHGHAVRTLVSVTLKQSRPWRRYTHYAGILWTHWPDASV